MSDLLSVDVILTYMTYFNSLQCSNSPDYVEPTEEPCVCPPGAPGLPGIKVSLWKKKKYISFLYYLLLFLFFVCFNHWQYKYGQHNSIISKTLSQKAVCLPAVPPCGVHTHNASRHFQDGWYLQSEKHALPQLSIFQRQFLCFLDSV